MSKAFLCTCEDLTVEDVRRAVVERGLTDLEAVKRYCGVATGFCQGKQCLLATEHLIADLTGQRVGDVGTIVHRPPVNPVPLGLLAGEERP